MAPVLALLDCFKVPTIKLKEVGKLFEIIKAKNKIGEEGFLFRSSRTLSKAEIDMLFDMARRITVQEGKVTFDVSEELKKIAKRKESEEE